MSKKGAGYRLRKELLAINKDRPEFIWATHKETNILLWSFLVAPPDDTVYGSGWYWGRVTFPQDYPFAPPGIQFVTPSGRFRPETKICMSMSDYHPESWNPAWSVSTILKGVLSFMLSDEITTGAVECSDSERRRLAQASVAWNTSQPEFNQLFPDFAELREEELLRRARPKNAGLIARGALDEAGLPGAAASKACGDAFFRAKNYEKAIEAYTLALKEAPGAAAVLRNRAAAHEKLQKWSDVENDAAASLKADAAAGEPVSAKALLRRAAALVQLSRVEDAIGAYNAALALNPPNADAIKKALAALDKPPPPPS